MRLDHLLSMENVKLLRGDNFVIQVDQNQKNTKWRDRLCRFACCSILSDQCQLKNPFKNGGVAQLGEHLPCKQGVMGSIPIISTISCQSIRSMLGEEIETVRLETMRKNVSFYTLVRSARVGF